MDFKSPYCLPNYQHPHPYYFPQEGKGKERIISWNSFFLLFFISVVFTIDDATFSCSESAPGLSLLRFDSVVNIYCCLTSLEF